MIGLVVSEARIFVRPGPTDMRKQINGLAVMVEDRIPLSAGHDGDFSPHPAVMLERGSRGNHERSGWDAKKSGDVFL